MITRPDEQRRTTEAALGLADGVHVLVVEAPYYRHITDRLLEGACGVLAAHRCTFEKITVPGALEIPQAVAEAAAQGLLGAGERFAGVIALGCVIRGETAHYDIVVNNANHWLMETCVLNRVPLGNAILTVDTEAQALARASAADGGKGGDAARACLRLIAVALELGKPVKTD